MNLTNILGALALTTTIVLPHPAAAQSMQAAAADQATPVSTTAQAWEDVTSLTLTSPSNADAVLVLANVEMEVNSSNQNVDAWFRVTDGATSSDYIERYVVGKSYRDKGLAAVAYVFNYTNRSTDLDITLQHYRNESGGSNKDFSTKGNMTAIVIDDDNVTLPYDMNTVASTSTTSTAYTVVSGSATDGFTLSEKSGILITAAFSSKGTAGDIADFKLQYSTDGSIYSDVTNAMVSRTSATNFGASTITIIMEDMDPTDYYFRLAYKTSNAANSLDVQNLTLIAVGLSEANGNLYKTFSTSGNSSVTTSSDASVAATTPTITGQNASSSLFVVSSFNMSSGATAITSPGFWLNVSNATFTPITFNRYLSSNSSGSGGLVGLATGLSVGSTHTVTLNHSASEGELTTNNISISGFELTRSPAFTGATDNDWNTAANWSNSSIPTAATDAVIPTGQTVTISATTSAQCANLVNDGTLTINSTATSSGMLQVNGTSTGNITYNRYLTNDVWHLVASPLVGQDVWDYATTVANSIAQNGSSQYAITTYNEGSDGWNSYPSTDPVETFTSGIGYSTRRSTTAGTVDFTGTYNTEDVTGLVLTRGNQGWNLLGNPYPTALNATTTADATNNLLTVNSANLDPSYAAIYVWDAASSSYKTIANSGGTLSQDYIQAGQAFFVRSKSGGGTFDITEAMQSLQPGESFLKNLGKPTPKLDLTATTGETSSNTVLTFGRNMTLGLDVTYDAGKMGTDPGVSIYTRLVEDNGIDFSVQSLPQQYEELEIPIGVKTALGNTVRFALKAENFRTDKTVYLEDRVSGITYDIYPGNEAVNIVWTSAYAELGSLYLKIIENQQITGFEQDQLGQQDPEPFDIQVRRYANQIEIMGDIRGNNTTATILDMAGRVCQKEALISPYSNTVQVRNLHSGVYLLHITDGTTKFVERFVW